MEKYFDINEDGYSIRCKIYCKDIHSTERVIIFCHGFGGHKDTKAAASFADRVISKYKSCALIIFDWPSHGQDAVKKLTLALCDTYLTKVINYAQRELHAQKLYASGTSFGAYLILKYIHEHGSVFEKIVLRCPVTNMYETMQKRIIDSDSQAKLMKGKDILVGFDRKIKIDLDFLKEIQNEDMNKYDFMDFADDILIVHGDRDEIVDYESSLNFSNNNVIELFTVPGADHRFIDPKKMDIAIHEMIMWLEL